MTPFKELPTLQILFVVIFDLFYILDEKEKYDPAGFRDYIVIGLNAAGSDLDAIWKFLDSAGSKVDYRRYGEALFDILIAGGLLGEENIACFVKNFRSNSPGFVLISFTIKFISFSACDDVSLRRSLSTSHKIRSQVH